MVLPGKNTVKGDWNRGSGSASAPKPRCSPPPFGDVVFQAEDGIWFLDTLEGSLTRTWDSTGALKADLATASGQDRYLLAGLAIGAEHQGLIPAPGQVYGFKTPPVIGGTLDLGNVEVIDFVSACISRAASRPGPETTYGHAHLRLHDQRRQPMTPETAFSITGLGRAREEAGCEG